MPKPEPRIDVAILTGGADKPYAFGLSKALLDRGLRVDLIAGDELDVTAAPDEPRLNFLNLRGDQRSTAGSVESDSRGGVLRTPYSVRCCRAA